MVTREQLLNEGTAATNAAVDELRRVASMTHAELVCEAIHRALVTIEVHRQSCKILPELFPEMGAIHNDDLAATLRLRLRLLEALREWSDKDDDAR